MNTADDTGCRAFDHVHTGAAARQRTVLYLAALLLIFLTAASPAGRGAKVYAASADTEAVQVSLQTAASSAGTAAVKTTGFLRINGKVYYYRNGKKLTGLRKIDGARYLFASPGGRMLTGYRTYKGHAYIFDTTTGRAQTGLFTYKGCKFYASPKNARLKTGFVKLDGKKYLFRKSSGKMCLGLTKYNGYTYYFDPDTGAMQTGFQTVTVGGRTRVLYFAANGRMVTGTVKIGGVQYTFSEKGYLQDPGRQLALGALSSLGNGSSSSSTSDSSAATTTAGSDASDGASGGGAESGSTDGASDGSTESDSADGASGGGSGSTSSGGGAGVTVNEALQTTGFAMSTAVRRQILSAVRTIEQAGNSVGFVVADLTSASALAYNCDEIFYSASTIKGPYVISLVSAQPDVLTQYGDTLRAIAVYSDNESYRWLYRTYGTDALRAFCARLGVTGDILWRRYPYYSARTLAKLWIGSYAILEKNEALGKLFEEPEYSAICDVLGGKYTTRSKGGWIGETGYNATNDAGIICAGDRPYVMAIMSDIPMNMPRLRALVAALDAAHGEM